MIILTGSNGLIGNAIESILKNKNHEVITIGRSLTNNISLDISENSLCLDKIVHRKPDAIIHCAASVPYSSVREDNQLAADSTRQIDKNMLLAAKKWQCPIIYTSGCSLYENTEANFCVETDKLSDHISSPYLSAKCEGDVAFAAYEYSTILRISAPVGINISESSVLGIFLKKAMHGEALELWGDGSREQDYIDVQDIAELVNKVISHPQFGVFNVASGKPITMKMLAQLVCSKVAACKIVFTSKSDPNANKYARFDIQKVMSAYDWVPQMTLSKSLDYIIHDYKKTKISQN